MNIKITEITPEYIEKYNIKEFLFNMIKTCYGFDYIPQYHYDIVNMEEYYINPEKNNFYMAIDTNNDQLIGTSAIRGYDQKYNIRGKNYSKENTASIYRVFVSSKYRHCKIGSKLVNTVEKFCKETQYNTIYLHTQKDSYGALPFWKHNNYKITHNTHDSMGTIHMEKVLQ